MAHLIKARQTDREYRFEGCPDAVGACAHANSQEDHHTYTWSIGGQNTMKPGDMLKEVLLLEAEAARRAAPAPGKALVFEGQDLAALARIAPL